MRKIIVKNILPLGLINDNIPWLLSDTHVGSNNLDIVGAILFLDMGSYNGYLIISNHGIFFLMFVTSNNSIYLLPFTFYFRVDLFPGCETKYFFYGYIYKYTVKKKNLFFLLLDYFFHVIFFMVIQINIR